MLILGPLGFTAPWLLVALAALPVLWVILRAMPPMPRVIVFPGVSLLRGLIDRDPVARRTPWWLLLLRLAAVAAVILGFAGPVWKPDPAAAGRNGPLLVVIDAGWAAAPGWQAAQSRATAALEAAGREGRPVALLLGDGRATGAIGFGDPEAPVAALRAARPAGWDTRLPEDPAEALRLVPDSGLEVLWLSDGLEHAGRAAWLAALNARGSVMVVPPAAPVASLELVPGDTPALRLHATASEAPAILALGPDPQGIPRVLARLAAGEAVTDAGITTWPVALDLPPEMRNRVARFEVESSASAGAAVLADDSVRRRKVGLVGSGATEAQQLLSPLHYLRQALAPSADLVEGAVADVLAASPDVVILADELVEPDDTTLTEWVEAGGLLIRFAGPRMAAAEALNADPLLPVRLRPGGRDIGGALSWGDPRGLAPFPEGGPFAGLPAPSEVAVRAQLMAEPDPDLAARTIARLSDATPLVTRAQRGAGQVVLAHVTANAEWSDLPLSGIFVAMLQRLLATAQAGTPEETAAAEATHWTAETALDGFGREIDELSDLVPVSAADLAAGPAPGVPPGIYAAGERRRAVNAGRPLTLATWPGATVEAAAAPPGLPLMGWLVALAALLLAADVVGSAWLARDGRRVAA